MGIMIGNTSSYVNSVSNIEDVYDDNSNVVASKIRYSYTVKDTDSGMFTSLEFINGTLHDVDIYNDVNFDVTGKYEIVFRVDNEKPYINTIIVKKNGNIIEDKTITYAKAGDTLSFEVSFNEKIKGNASVTFMIDNESVTLNSSSEEFTNTLVFEYTLGEYFGTISNIVFDISGCEDEATNSNDESDQFAFGTIIVLEKSQFSVERVTDVLTINSFAAGKEIYRIKNENPITFNTTNLLVQGLFKVLVSTDGVTFNEYSNELGTSASLQISVTKASNYYSASIKATNVMNISQVLYLKLDVNGEITDGAGNTGLFESEAFDSIEYDNLTRDYDEIKFDSLIDNISYEIDGRKFVKVGATIKVSVKFNKKLNSYSNITATINRNSGLRFNLTTVDYINYIGMIEITSNNKSYLGSSGELNISFTGKIYGSNDIENVNVLNSMNEENTSLYYDKDNPVVSIRNERDNVNVDNSKIYVNSKGISFTFTCSDGSELYSSGCADSEFSVTTDGNSKVQTEGYVVNISEVTNDTIITYIVKDKVGNIVTNTIKLYYDNVKPTYVISGISDGNVLRNTISDSKSINVRVNDDISGIKNVGKYCIVSSEEDVCDEKDELLGSIALPTTSGSYKLILSEAIDNATNISDEVIINFTIDNDGPVVSGINYYVTTEYGLFFDEENKEYIYSNISSNGMLYVVLKLNEMIDVKSTKVSSTMFTLSNNSYDNNEVTILLSYFGTREYSKELANITITIVDIYGNVREVPITNIYIDNVVEANATITLDNDYYKNPTMISNVEILGNEKDDVEIEYYNGEVKVESLTDIEFKDSVNNVKVILRDKVGNIKEFVKEFNVDIVPPTFTFELSDDTGTLPVKDGKYISVNKQNIRLTIRKENATDSIFVNDQELEGCTTKSCDYTINFEDDINEITLRVYTKDKATNKSTESEFTVQYVDLELIADNSEYAQKHNVTIKNKTYINKIDYYNSEISGFALNLLDESISFGDKSINGDKRLGLRVYLGETSSYFKDLSIVLHFDNEVTGSVSASYNNKWVKDSLEVTITYTGTDYSGIKSVELVSTSDSEKVYACPVSENTYKCLVTERGIYSIKVVDNAGNEKIFTSISANIVKDSDNQYQIAITGYDSESWYNMFSPTIIFTNNVEELKGNVISKVYYVLSTNGDVHNSQEFMSEYTSSTTLKDAGFRSTSTGATYTANFDVNELNGTYYFYVYMETSAGTSMISKLAIKLDTSDPIVEINMKEGCEDAYCVYTEFDSLFTITDSYSAVNTSRTVIEILDSNGNKQTEYSSLEGIYTIRVKAYDNVNNETIKEFENIMIDNRGPIIERINRKTSEKPKYKIIDNGSGLNEKLLVEYCITAEDQCSDIEEITIHMNENGEYIFELPAEGAIGVKAIIRVSDKLKNSTEHVDDQIDFDTVKPHVEINGLLNSDIAKAVVKDGDFVIEDKKYYTNDKYLQIVVDETTPSRGNYIRIVPSDVGHGVDYYCIWVGNNNRNNCTKTEKISSVDLTLYTQINIIVVDKAGNLFKTAIKINTFNDKAIEFNLSASTIDPATSNSISIQLVNSDVEEYIKEVTYKISTVSYSIDYANRATAYYDSYSEEISIEGLTTGTLNTNGIYIVKIVDAWGNVSYNHIVISNIDNEAPEFTEINENGDRLMSITGDIAYIYNEDGTYTKLNDYTGSIDGKTIHYTGKLNLNYRKGVISDDLNEIFCIIYDLSNTCIEKDITGIDSSSITLEDLTGISFITIKAIDRVGNVSEKSVKFYIEEIVENDIDIAFEFDKEVNDDAYYNDLKFKLNIIGDGNKLKNVKYYITDVDGNKYCEYVGSLILENRDVICSGVSIDEGIYKLHIEHVDIFGHEKVEPTFDVKLDNVAPSNSKEKAEFVLRKVGEDYYLSAKTTLDANITMKVYYKNGKLISLDDPIDASEITQIDESNAKLEFYTVMVDRAGNVSQMINYEENLKVGRGISAVDTTYDAITKKVTISFDISGKVGNVTYKIYDASSLEEIDYRGIEYRITTKDRIEFIIGKDSTLFSEGIIDTVLKIEVFDEYTVEGEEMIGAIENLQVQYDTNDPKVTLDERSSTIIANNTNEDVISKIFVKSTKELSNLKYVIEYNSSTSVVTTVSQFNYLYNECDQVSKYTRCTRGENLNNDLTIKVNSQTSLGSRKALIDGQYRIVVMGVDKYGNTAISVIGYVNIDNTAPTFTANKSSSFDISGSNTYYYSESVTISIKDVLSYNNSDNIDHVEINGNRLILNKCSTDNSAYCITLGSSNYPDGTYTIKAIDKAGNYTENIYVIDQVNNGIYLKYNNEIYYGNILNRNMYDSVLIGVVDKSDEIRTITFRFKSGDRLLSQCVVDDWDMSEIALQGFINSNCKSSASKVDSSNNVEIITVNKTGKSETQKFELDFIIPVITHKTYSSYNGISFIHKDSLNSTLNVIVNKKSTNDSKAGKFADMITRFVNNIDGMSYSIARTTGRVIISLGEQRINANEDLEFTENIFAKTGIYTMTVSYTDAAGNVANPLVLTINVIDTKAPSITLNGVKHKQNLTLNIENKEGIKYTNNGLVITDDYGLGDELLERYDGVCDSDASSYCTLVIAFRPRNSSSGYDTIVSFNERGEFIYNGKVYAIKEGNEYTFILPGEYLYTYTARDTGNNTAEAYYSLTVMDGHAPEITDTNIIKIDENGMFTVDGVTYTINYEEGIITGGDEDIVISQNMFVLANKKYMIGRDRSVLYFVANIGSDSSKPTLCFENEKCNLNMETPVANDKESGVQKIYITKIMYSLDGSSYKINNSSYILEGTGVGDYKVIFNYLGYYKITMRSTDPSNNYSEIEYIVFIEDITAPVFIYENNEITTETIEKEFTYDEIYEKVRSYTGRTIVNKITNYLNNSNGWVLKNITVRDNYDASLTYKISSITQLDRVRSKEYLRFEVKLVANDKSNNYKYLTIYISIKDETKPDVSSLVYELSYDGASSIDLRDVSELYTNADNLYYRISGGSDNIEFKYQCLVVINELSDDNWIDCNAKEFILAYSAIDISNITSVQILFRLVDDVGNVSDVVSTPIVKFDKVAPVMSLVKDDVTIDLPEDGIFTDISNFNVYFSDNSYLLNVVGYWNNNKYFTTSSNNEGVEINGFGHYKFVVVDRAGNESIYEFIIMPTNNTLNVIDRENLAAEDKEGNDVEYDKIILQKVTSSRAYLEYYGDYIIQDDDAIYFMGIVPDKSGSVFSIISSGVVSGKSFRVNATSFQINIDNNISDVINPSIGASNYVINFKGDYYIMLCIKIGGYDDPNPDPEPVNPDNGGNKDKKSSNFTWVFYVLGGIGAIGGGFLIMKLRRKVRAA